MVMLSTLQAGRVAKVESAAVEANTLQVVSAEIHDAISQCYRCELELVSSRTDLDSAALLQNAAYVGIKQGVTIKGSDKRGVQTLKYHGVFSSFEQCEKREDLVRYRAVLVPRLWKLSLNVQSRIFMEKTVPEIVEEVVKGAGLDYEFRTAAREYPTREYVAQYQESDLAFVSRLLEHEGIFFFFVQGDEGEKVVFGDSQDAFEPILGDAVLPYRSGGAEGAGNQPQDWFLPEIVYSFTARHYMVPTDVVLQDYNYRTPSVSLKSSASVGSSGHGTVYEYGSHYKDMTEGGDLAKVRAEEIKCREIVFLGTSDGKSMRAGATFEITEHYRSDFNGTYLVTEVRHKIEQSVTLKATAGSVASYENEFVCIPADVVFRPERRTPKPRISGTMNAKVDAAADGPYAEIDGTGRYKIRNLFDLSEKSEGTASRYMRMVQPYSGAGMGMHFPLHKGTEVVLAFTNGDPDRPIVVGSVPNAETVGPVTGSNQTQCKIFTGGGNEFRIEDTDGAQYMTLRSPASNTYFSLGHEHHSDPNPTGATLSTEGGVTVNGEAGVSIASGAADHETATQNASTHANTLVAGIAGAIAVVATASTLAAEYAATKTIPLVSAALDAAGLLTGFIGHEQNVYVSSPTKVAVMAGGELLLGAGMTADLTAIGPVNIMSAAGTLIAAGAGGCFVTGGDMEHVSVLGNITVHSKTGVIKEEAKWNIDMIAESGSITMKAKTGTIEGEADSYIKLDTHDKMTVVAKKEIEVTSSESKKITFTAGNSTLVMEDGKITITANEIGLTSKDGKAVFTLKDGGTGGWGCDGKITVSTKDTVEVTASSDIDLIPDGKIHMTAPSIVISADKLDETGAKAIERANSKEG